jgi:hypothetical protein
MVFNATFKNISKDGIYNWILIQRQPLVPFYVLDGLVHYLLLK